MKLPSPRGSVSAALIDTLAGRRTTLPHTPVPDDDEDLHLALFVCYELAYRGWDGVDDRWEWDPGLLRARRALEDHFETALHALAGPPEPVDASAVPHRLIELATADDGPSLSGYLRGRATHEQFREFVTHRSVYHLREADPHTFTIPRLAGRAKAALIEIQFDEYGGGALPKMHQEMFKRTMRWFGLDLTYGAYVDDVGAATLATNNVMSLFALHRRNRAALLGHLAAYEMTSSIPNRAYANGLRRLGGDASATAFYDEHVEADAVHEQIAAHDMCGSFAAAEPELAGDLLYGARCALALDARWAGAVLAAWEADRSSLRDGASLGSPRAGVA
ncbi:iron-containing redox enzyme family protein [Actinoplanes sp. NEAU-A12]|uniref:Iron-containing redox enzyme family protein n=1 Tax=Actinoplanes sandaracinus TaxID=3045177 RepID=A0ABT6WUF1_9ACTN|nr:iron-containing redox enzyme family protein [Actinoplanes sandaracinus]MDI6103376.1 iron-containing redox enzyme family protein [Actinoplanes sandaracinus]